MEGKIAFLDETNIDVNKWKEIDYTITFHIL